MGVSFFNSFVFFPLVDDNDAVVSGLAAVACPDGVDSLKVAIAIHSGRYRIRTIYGSISIHFRRFPIVFVFVRVAIGFASQSLAGEVGVVALTVQPVPSDLHDCGSIFSHSGLPDLVCEAAHHLVTQHLVEAFKIGSEV